MTDLTHAQRVANGASAITRYEGDRGWLARLDVAQIDISNPRMCALGQLYGDFNVGLSKVFTLDEQIRGDIATHGFNGESVEDQEALSSAWRDYVARERLTDFVDQHAVAHASA